MRSVPLPSGSTLRDCADSFRCSQPRTRLLGRLAAPSLFRSVLPEPLLLGFPVSGLTSSALTTGAPVPGVPGVLPPYVSHLRLARPSPLFLHRPCLIACPQGRCSSPPRGCPASAPSSPQGSDLEPSCPGPSSAACIWVSGPARGPQGCVNRLWTCPYLGNSGKIPSQNLGNAENAKIPRGGVLLLDSPSLG